MHYSSRSQKNQMLFKAFPEWKSGGGIFSSLVDPPWGSDTGPLTLDIMYYGMHSGGKYISPLLYYYLDDNGVVTEENRAILASVIKDMFYRNWEHLWDTYTKEYDPLNNYNITEEGVKETSSADTGTVNDTETQNLSETNVGTTTLGKTGTITDLNTQNLSEHVVVDETSKTDLDSTVTTGYGHVIDTTAEGSSTTNDRTFGFNSDTAGVPTATSTTETTNGTGETHSGTDTVTTDSTSNTDHDADTTKTNTGTDTNQRTLATTDTTQDNYTKQNTGTDTHLKTLNTENTGNEEYEWVRTGTVNKSPSELLLADRELWVTSFFQKVFEDVDSVLALDLYPDRQPNFIYY